MSDNKDNAPEIIYVHNAKEIKIYGYMFQVRSRDIDIDTTEYIRKSTADKQLHMLKVVAAEFRELANEQDKQREEILKPIRDVMEEWKKKLPHTEWGASAYICDMERAIKETLSLADKAGK